MPHSERGYVCAGPYHCKVGCYYIRNSAWMCMNPGTHFPVNNNRNNIKVCHLWFVPLCILLSLILWSLSTILWSWALMLQPLHSHPQQNIWDGSRPHLWRRSEAELHGGCILTCRCQSKEGIPPGEGTPSGTVPVSQPESCTNGKCPSLGLQVGQL